MPKSDAAGSTKRKIGRPRKEPPVPGHIGRPRKNWLKRKRPGDSGNEEKRCRTKVSPVVPDDDAKEIQAQETEDLQAQYAAREGETEQDEKPCRTKSSPVIPDDNETHGRTQTSPVINRRPARFLSRSPTPEAPSSESEAEEPAAAPQQSQQDEDESNSSSSDSSSDEDDYVDAQAAPADANNNPAEDDIPSSPPHADDVSPFNAPIAGLQNAPPSTAPMRGTNPPDLNHPTRTDSTPPSVGTRTKSSPSVSKPPHVKPVARPGASRWKSLNEQIAEATAAPAAPSSKLPTKDVKKPAPDWKNFSMSQLTKSGKDDDDDDDDDDDSSGDDSDGSDSD
jgi:hypothetical protein